MELANSYKLKTEETCMGMDSKGDGTKGKEHNFSTGCIDEYGCPG